MKMLLALFFIGAMSTVKANDLLREVVVNVISVEHNYQCCNDGAGILELKNSIFEFFLR